MNYEIGQIFEKRYPPEVAIWCNDNNAYIEEIEPVDGHRRFQIVAIPEPEPLTKKEIEELYDKRIEQWIDETANSRRYRTADSCVSYIGDVNPKYDREARAFKLWRSSVYTRCEELLSEYLDKDVSEIPSVEEIIQMLPQIDWNDPEPVHEEVN